MKSNQLAKPLGSAWSNLNSDRVKLNSNRARVGLALIWVDGYYNGDIKTRKTLQPTGASAEEDSGVQRSQQLKELYYSLLAGESNQPPARRPYVALSAEDLTDLEWFYVLCISFSFPPGVGLPGKAYAEGRHIWLSGAHEVDNKIFSRSILAKVWPSVISVR
ncbi:hypothetical protein Cgig2_016381 [Carnegiea gigantea]|uniref:Transcription factor MYC/MYB N-terminal domain-containing protein n=1 Tax=Carnegiea gigantea TaxID=171969 RepID=A0A9Q1K846_9CARY|nr:hypothetical protein Cgig2_016381 [Carnegiea gigantea]